MFFKVILILPPVQPSNLGSDLSINTVRLYLADTKIASQDPVNKALEFTEKWKTSEVNSNSFLEICWKHDTSLQSLGIHDSSAFYSTLSLFFGFSRTSLFVRYFGSISRFEQYVRRVEKITTVADKWWGDSNNFNCNPVPAVLKKR